MKLLSIEKKFKDMCDSSDRNQYFFEKYILFKHVLFELFYETIREEHRGFTDHSHKHIQKVLKKASDLCVHRINTLKEDDPEYIRLFEVYLLLMSIIFHDVSMIIEKRSNHGDLGNILKLFDNIILTDDERDWIKRIVKCHTSGSDIDEEMPVQEKLVLGDFKIRPKFIAALLRLSDELDESKARANFVWLQTNKIPSDQIIFHKISESFDGISPQHEAASINIELSFTSDMINKKYEKVDHTSKVKLLEEVLDRVDKMNIERKYCMSFTTAFVEYKSINLKLFIWNKDKSICSTIEYILDDNNGIKDFLKDKKDDINRAVEKASYIPAKKKTIKKARK